MTKLTPPATVPIRSVTRDGRRRLFRHVLEMALAMVAGMLLLGPPRAAVGDALGFSAVLDRADVGALLMATDMSLGMAAWMRYRRHSWPAIGEMTVAMYLPVVLLAVPFRVGLVGADAMLVGAHLLMVPAMAVAVLRRRDEYARHPSAAPRMPHHPFVAVLAHRWPTGLALLVTLDTWFAPSVPDPWLLLVLPGAYLLIGAYRRRLGDPRVLGVQLAGLAGWTALAVVAVAVDDGLTPWLVAFGWLAHAGWDAVHHRADAVVPRGYAEWCGVVDAVIGITVLLSLVSG